MADPQQLTPDSFMAAQGNTAPRPDARPGPYITALAPADEQRFQSWVKANRVPFDPSPTADYDMRGYWKSQQAGGEGTKVSAFDRQPHFPDTYKTPYHKTFSNESRYATPDAPHWDGDRLIDKSGRVLADETPQKGLTPDSFMAAVRNPPKPSEALPTPDQAVEEATNTGRAIAEAATRPAPTDFGYGELGRRLLNVFRQGAIPQSLQAGREAAARPPRLKPGRNEVQGPDMSTPVLDFTQLTPQPGIARGAAEFASGLTSPENLGVMAATGGVGVLAGGVGALEKTVGKGLLSRMVSAGFSYDMLNGLLEQTPELKEAWKKRDLPKVRQILTRMTLSGAMAIFAARHAAGKGEKTSVPATSQTQPQAAAAQPTTEGLPAGPAEPGQRPAAQPSHPAAAGAAAPEVGRGHGGDQSAAQPRPAGGGGGISGQQPPLPQGHGREPLRQLPGALPGGPGGGEPQQHAGSEGASTRRITGSADQPLTAAGKQQARQLEVPAGTHVFHAPNDRSSETARAANREAQPAEWLEPWKLGEHEGKPLPAAQSIIDHLMSHPDESPGVSPHSGEQGEPYRQARNRLVVGAARQRAAIAPADRVLNVTSGRAIAIIGGDPHQEIKTGQIYRWTAKGLAPVDDVKPGTQNFVTHAETPWNPANRPQSVAEKPQSATPYDTPGIVAARKRAANLQPTAAIQTPERVALRQHIADRLYRTDGVERGKQAYIVIGPPAGGKSTITEPLARETHSLAIDADDAKQLLPEYGKGEGAGAVHEESGAIANQLLTRASDDGLNIVHPILGRNIEKVRAIRNMLAEQGYDVHLVHVDVPLETAAQRAVARFEDTGRFVDPALILNKTRGSAKVTYDTLKREGGFQSHAEFSNDLPNTAPRFVEGRNFDALRLFRSGGGPERGVLPPGPPSERSEAAKPNQQVAERTPGWVGNIPTSDIHVDAPRFQFKANVGQGGAGEEFRGVQHWDPELAGVVHVWLDPADGKTYVVNGHHRVEMAQRLGVKDLTVRYLDAPTAMEARLKGALINIAEGHGESTDAAKMFRDSRLTPEQLAARGISLKGKVTSEGMALAKLAQPIFDDVIAGRLTPARGAVIGAGVPRHADQVALYDIVRKMERGGRRLTNDQLAELIRMNSRTATKTESSGAQAQASMFGEEEMTRSLLPEKAIVSDYVRQQLRSEKKLFSAVASEAAAERLGEAGNVIQAGTNAQTAERANQGILLYDRLSSSAGAIDGILDRAAQRLANGENANDAKQQAYRETRDYLARQIRQLAGEDGGRAGEGLPPGDRAAGAGQLDRAGATESGIAPPIAGQADPEYQSRIDAERVTAELASQSRRPVDAGREPIEDSPLFGGPRQEDLFGLPAAEELAKPEEKKALKEFLGEETGTSLVGSILKADLDGMRALKAKRDAAFEALAKAAPDPAEKAYGQRLVEYYTGERDMWVGRVNQVLDRLRKMVPGVVERTGLSIYRDYKGRPGELRQWLDGSHLNLRSLNAAEYTRAMENIQKLRPAILQALHPTARMLEADKVLTRIAEASFAEGHRLGFIPRELNSERYFTHLLFPKNADTTPVPISDRLGKAVGGKIGRDYAFSQPREYRTILDAIADNVVPKTLNVFDAFSIHGDKFATARATHLLIEALQRPGAGGSATGLAMWGKHGGKNVPRDWVELARHSRLFANEVHFEGENGPELAEQMLFVPKVIDKALRPITDPDYLDRLPLFRALRQFQSYTKAIQLGLSFFHVTTENYMALANMGPKGWIQGLRADRESADFLRMEREFIAHGGTTSILGRTVEAYKSLEPGLIPTWGDIWKRAPLIREVDALAGKITEFTFDKIQRKFKVTDYAIHKAAWLADHPQASAMEQRAAFASMAKEINAVYGGLNWENIGLNHMGVEVARAVMLAPDWTISNVFNIKYSMERGTPAGKMARMFWARQLVGGMVATELMSLAISGQLSKNPTQVYMGKDASGEDIYQNLFFKGASGDVFNFVHNVLDYGFPLGAVRSMAGKAAPVLRTGLELGNNTNFLGQKLIPRGMSPVASTVRGVWEVGKSLAPTPLTVTNWKDMLIGPNADKYSVPEFFTVPFAGTPPRHVPPGGMHMRHGELETFEERPNQSVWDEIVSGKR